MKSVIIFDTKDGFPVIKNGPTLKRGVIIQAIKADRDSREHQLVKRGNHQ